MWERVKIHIGVLLDILKTDGLVMLNLFLDKRDLTFTMELILLVTVEMFIEIMITEFQTLEMKLDRGIMPQYL